MTREEFDRRYREYDRASDKVVCAAATWMRFRNTGCEPNAEGHLLGAVMRYKLLQVDLPRAKDVTS